MNNRLTWFDWTLIAIGIFLVAHMSVLVAMSEDAAIGYEAVKPFAGLRP